MKNHSARPVAENPVAHGTAAVPELIAATAHTLPEQVDALVRARNFAEPLIAGEQLDTGENALDHADAVAAIAQGLLGGAAGDWRMVAVDVDGCDLSDGNQTVRLAFLARLSDSDAVRAALIRATREGRARLTG